MRSLISPLRARPRLILSFLAGAIMAWAAPASLGQVTRGLLGWNVAVWTFLLLIGWVMWRADHTRLRRIAVAQSEGAATVLAIVTLAALVSLAGIVAELSAAKVPGAPHALPHVLFALVTVAGSWTLVPVMFTLTYASAYCGTPPAGGLGFPDSGPDFSPHYGDFLYFAFTIAVASQTADVSVTSRRLRRLVLFQSVLSFVFNTAILAFTINVAASLF